MTPTGIRNQASFVSRRGRIHQLLGSR